MRDRPSRESSNTLERAVQVIQLLATVATLGFLPVGFFRFNATPKSLDGQQKQFEAEDRIEAESRLHIEKIKTTSLLNSHEAREAVC